MTKAQIEQFFDTLNDMIAESEPWQEKKKALLDLADDRDKTNLSEFVAWFDADNDLEEIDPTEDA